LDQQKSTQIFIISRLGLGQRNGSFFQTALPYFFSALVPSISAQEDPRFHWLVLVDTAAPKWAIEKIGSVKETVPQFSLHLHDPFRRFDLMPEVGDLLREKGAVADAYTITARVDADDALSRDYVSSLLLHSEIAQKSSPVSAHGYISRSGAVYYSASAKTLAIEKEDYSAVAIGSKFNRNFVHCYDFPHTQVWRGGESLAVINMKSPTPHWLRVMRPGSVHRSSPGLRFGEFADYFPRLRQLASKVKQALVPGYTNRLGGLLEDNLLFQYFSIDFQVLSSGVARARKIPRSRFPSQILRKYGPDGRAGLNQLALKARILSLSKEMSAREENQISNLQKIHDLREEFYSF